MMQKSAQESESKEFTKSRFFTKERKRLQVIDATGS